MILMTDYILRHLIQEKYFYFDYHLNSMNAALVIDSIEPSLVVYAFGAIFGVLSILYFARDILLSLSLTVKSIIMYAFSLSLLVLGVSVGNSILSIVLLVVGGAGYAISSFYVIRWYNRERMGRFILFAISSVLFVLLGWLISSGATSELSIQNSVIISGILILVSIVASVTDWREGNTVRYEANIREKVGEDGEVGTIKISNNSRMFRKTFSTPNVNGTIEINDFSGDVPIRITSSIGNQKMNTIGHRQEVTIDISTGRQNIEQILQKKDILVPDDMHISVENYDTTEFELDEDGSIDIKIT